MGPVAPILSNRVTHKSRQGELGRVIVRRFSGVDQNKAHQALVKFQQNTEESHEGIASTLMASKTLPKGMRRVAEALLDPKNKRKSLSFLVAENGADAADVIEHYAKGAVQLNRYEVLAMAAKEMPRVIRDLIRYTIPKKTLCKTCLGHKEITVQGKHGKRLPEKCLTCQGTGWEGDLGKGNEFAIEKVAAIAGFLQDSAKNSVNVQVQQNNVTQVTQGRLMERILGLSEAEDDVIDVTPVEIEAEK